MEELYEELLDEVEQQLVDKGLIDLRQHLYDAMGEKWDNYTGTRPTVEQMNTFVDTINKAYAEHTLSYQTFTAALSPEANNSLTFFRDLFHLTEEEFNERLMVMVDFPTILREIENSAFKTILENKYNKNQDIKSCTLEEANALRAFFLKINEIIQKKGYLPQEEYDVIRGEIKNEKIRGFLSLNKDNSVSNLYVGSPAQAAAQLYQDLSEKQNEEAFIRQLGELSKNPNISVAEIKKLFDDNVDTIDLMPSSLHRMMSDSPLIKMKTDKGESFSLPQPLKLKQKRLPIQPGHYKNPQLKEMRAEIESMKKLRKSPTPIVEKRRALRGILSSVKNPEYRRALGDRLLSVPENFNKITIESSNEKVIKQYGRLTFERNKKEGIVRFGNLTLDTIVDAINKSDAPISPDSFKNILQGIGAASSLYDNNIDNVEQCIKTIDIALNKLKDPALKTVMKALLRDDKKVAALRSLAEISGLKLPSLQNLSIASENIATELNGKMQQMQKMGEPFTASRYLDCIVEASGRPDTSTVLFKFFTDAKQVMHAVETERAKMAPAVKSEAPAKNSYHR